jgi:hypothetical protein
MKNPDAENHISVLIFQPFTAQLGERKFTKDESLFKEFLPSIRYLGSNIVSKRVRGGTRWRSG